MKKKLILIIIFGICLIILGLSIIVISSMGISKQQVNTKENLEEKALKIITINSEESDDEYTFQKIDENGNYVFKASNDSLIIVDLENESYTIETSVQVVDAVEPYDTGEEKK